MTDFHSHRISQLHDAQMDMIEKLNHLTDIPYDPCRHTPDFQDYQAMCFLSKAIKDLQKTICMINEVEDEEEQEIMERASMRCDTKMAHTQMAHDIEHMKSKNTPA